MSSMPKNQGLYSQEYEKDACGIGFVVNIDGTKTHKTVDDAITVLENLSHRGASGADPDTGDGAGITTQIPHAFFYRQCKNLGITLPEKGSYGIATIFAHKYNDFKDVQLEKFKEIIESEGQTFLGYRKVPVDSSSIGLNSQRSMPSIYQAFIQKDDSIESSLDFERKLYLIRRKAEKIIVPMGVGKGGIFYISGCSSKTIIYKGLLTAKQLRTFYLDLSDLDYTSALALVHSRFSTNTFPSWERAHPNRYIIHNGEINTIRGNVNWMKARQQSMHSPYFKNMEDVFPVIDETGSDSSMLDNAIEFFYLTGRSLPHTLMMLIPEPWENSNLSTNKKEFYKFNNFLMEPWEGPAAIAFTDGDVIGATLDRNGLRPARYYITKDNSLILSSEVGVLEFDPSEIIQKGRLKPGKMLVVDTLQKRIIPDDEIKESISNLQPYQKWNEEHLVTLDDFETSKGPRPKASVKLKKLQKAFGYTYEDVHKIIKPMALQSKEEIGAMGMDIPLAVLSQKPQLLFNYFKQLFAQVTNPPIDGIREKNVISSTVLLGSVGNVLEPHIEGKSSLLLDGPILSNGITKTIKDFDNEHFKTLTVSLLYKKDKGPQYIKRALEKLFKKVDEGVKQGYNLFMLSDKGVNKNEVAIPSLLAASGLHHHLIRKEIRTDVGIIIETAEAREVHHFATLFGYGVTAINPYLVFETLKDLTRNDFLGEMEYQTAKKNYIKAATKGILKVITKMGISTLRSYHGSQIYEAVGIKQEVIKEYFEGTPSRIEGIGLVDILEETFQRHNNAFMSAKIQNEFLDTGSTYQYRALEETHLYDPETIYLIQRASRENDYALFKEFSHKISNDKLVTLRNLLEFQINPLESVPIEEVESVESIVKRFKSGAMSYGSLSKEAHETLAIAMNHLGAKSNSGEGGEDEERFLPRLSGEKASSAIKQVASGRFGVTSNYLINATEIQIKIAQGAKPGEGGHLPSNKVFPEIAYVRHSTPGVGLISPPPHHDIYSIEDLAQLIHDLKMANNKARIGVKLVSEVGVGTVAAGVAKGKADVILISGYDGGTGASPKTSIMHAGLPWELGLSEVHQTLLLNNLRNKITVETDGKLLTGRDIAIAACLGAEEFGFATAPLVTMGCIMMRVCNKNTCPVGIATQDKTLRENFSGKPEYVINFMRFIAMEMREIMAQLGIRTVSELVGRTDKLKQKELPESLKASKVDLSKILYKPHTKQTTTHEENINELHSSIDYKYLINIAKNALYNNQKVIAKYKIDNTNRVVGTMLGSEITKLHGPDAFVDDTIVLQFIGSAGQSFGAFIPKGLTLLLEGDANDYVGKGLSGGKIIAKTPDNSPFEPSENIIIGNVAFYGGTQGEAYINGQAGERFCVRNSGVTAVVEGVGDHGCEYMTGGTVLILGETGENFAAGMSGGIAYVHDLNPSKCNQELVELHQLSNEDELLIKELLENHFQWTKSKKARLLLDNFQNYVKAFTKVLPIEYRKMMEEITSQKAQGLSTKEAYKEAFQIIMNEEVK